MVEFIDIAAVVATVEQFKVVAAKYATVVMMEGLTPNINITDK